jgi:hypothetical protein
MNSIHVLLAVLLTTVTCFAQGQVNFANRVGAGGSILNAPVTIIGTQTAPGPDFSAQLLLVGANGSLTPLIPISTFNRAGTGAAAVASQFWAPQTITIDGHFGGESLTFRVRVWRTSEGSYDAALDRGSSADFTAILGGPAQDPNVPPSTPANLTNLKSFTFGFPEPSTITLGLLGAAALVMFRRRA